MVDQAFLDIIRGRLSLYEVVSAHVRLKKAGQNYLGLCPFHPEKSPSFTVSPRKNFYHCFGCGAHGDIFSFVEKQQNLTFFEAVSLLAQKVGLALPEKKTTQEGASLSKDMLDAHQQAKLFYQKHLLSPEGHDARYYLQERGVKEEAIHLFGLGLAPKTSGYKALTDELIRQGFSLDLLLKGGLSFKTEKGQILDRFRGRLMFPILSRTQKVIAFGGRSLDETMPKYLNSPETLLFQKNKELYRTPHLKAQEPLIVVEGYLDVISLTLHGFQAVAPLGTALSEHHLEMIWRLHAEPYVCFDGDAAGQKAALRMIERALPLLKSGMSLFFITLPETHDPDTYLRSFGAEAFQKTLSQATPLFDKILYEEYKQKPLNTPERVADFQKRLDDIGHVLKDPHLKRAYQRWIQEKTYSFFKKKSRPSPAHLPVADLSINGLKYKKESALLAVVVKFPELLEGSLEEFGHIHLSHPELKKLQETLLNAIFCGTPLDNPSILKHLHEKGLSRSLDPILKEKAFHLVPFAQNDTLTEDVRLGWRDLLNRFEKTTAFLKKNN